MIILNISISDYLPVIIQILVTAGVIFGGAGFWQWKQSKDQAKRDAQNSGNTLGNKVDNLSDQLTALTTKVDAMLVDVQEIKDDIALLERANAETIKYREFRENNDKHSAVIQAAVIESLKGMLRERLLDNYKRCIKKGFYTKEEREIYGEMFKCYESEPFNGNGVMHQLRPVMQSLPWTAQEAKHGKLEDSAI